MIIMDKKRKINNMQKIDKLFLAAADHLARA